MHKNDRLRPWETALLAAVCVTLLTGVWAQGRQSALADKVVRLHVIAAFRAWAGCFQQAPA